MSINLPSFFINYVSRDLSGPQHLESGMPAQKVKSSSQWRHKCRSTVHERMSERSHHSVFFNLREKLEESDVIRTVDVVNLKEADDKLRKRVVEEGILWTE